MNTDVAIPFLDLVTPHVELEEELTTLFRQCFAHCGFHWWSDGGELREGICRVLRNAPCNRSKQRHGCTAIRDHRKRSAGRRCCADSAEYFHCHNRGDFTGACNSGVCRCRRAHVQHVGRDAATLPAKEMRSRQVGPAHQSAQRARRYCDRPCAPLRTDGRHGSRFSNSPSSMVSS